MSNKNNLLLNSLWFLVGRAAIAAIPLLLLEQCLEARRPGTRENQARKQGAVDHPIGKQAVCGKLVIGCRAL